MKILHLPSNVAGNAFGLAQGERQLGLDSKALSIGKSIYHFPSDLIIPAKKTLLNQFYHRVKTFLEVRGTYDVYHFNFGSSLLHYMKFGLNLADLPYYNEHAVKVVTYQGCDARQKYPTIARINQNATKTFAACFYDKCYDGICNSGRRDQMRQRAIEKMMQHCQHAFALNPDLLYFLPQNQSSFLPYTIPNFDSIRPKRNAFFQGDRINIVHAPTQRVTKGSAYIINAIKTLEQEFPGRIFFQLVENMPYEKALDIYRGADLVIDQVLIGWYGGLAVEVMKMGIPIVAYINEENFELIPEEFTNELPIINVTIDSLTTILRKIIQEREQLIEKGQQAKQFVERWHHPEYVASITKKVYQRCVG